MRGLKATSRDLQAHIGTSFLEVDGDHFYDTFVLTRPDGEIAGRVRKQRPAGAEGFFFAGESGSRFYDLSATGGLRSPPGTHVAGWYANRLGIPAVMVNKVGAWSTQTASGAVNGTFPGLSAVVDGGGTVRVLLDAEQSVGVAEVLLDPTRRAVAPRPCAAEFNAELAIDAGGRAELGIQEMEAQAADPYANNEAHSAQSASVGRLAPLRPGRAA